MINYIVFSEFCQRIFRLFQINFNGAGRLCAPRPRLLFFSVPAIGAAIAGGQTCGGEHIVQPVVTQGSKLQLTADGFDHRRIFGRIGVCICLQLFFVSFAFQRRNFAAGDQFQFGRGTRKIQVGAAVQEGRAGKADVQFFCAALV